MHFFSLLVLVFLNFPLWANEKPNDKSQVKPLMHRFYQNITVLKDYSQTTEKFADKKNEAEIGAKLKDLADLSKEMKGHQSLNSPGFKISQHTLGQHLADLERTYRVGNKAYARWMLRSTFFICSSCHSQLPQSPTSNWEKSKDTLSVSTKPSLDDADFLFATRRFDESLAMYDRLVNEFPRNGVGTEVVDQALRKKLMIFSRIKRDPARGLLNQEKSLKNTAIPEHMKKNIRAWNALLREWRDKPVVNPTKANDTQIKAFAESKLNDSLWDRMIEASDPKVVTYLQVSGILYEYLDRNPKSTLSPQILLWLSQCDRQVNNEFFFSLADLYLKECIIQYPTSDIAPLCYKELEKQTILSYTGSSGTNIPLEIQSELTALKKRLK